MATHLFVVESGKHRVGNTVAWEYEADSNGITFHNKYANIKDIHEDGKFVNRMVMFKAEGSASEFLGFARLPKDERLAYLWKKGFRKATRTQNSDVVSQMVERHGGNEKPSHFENNWTFGEWNVHNMKHLMVQAPDGEILFNAIFGQVGQSNDTDRLWYMNEKAALADVMAAFEENVGFSEYTWDVADAISARKANMKPGYLYCTYTKQMSTFVAKWIVIENRNGEDFDPDRLGNIDYERKFVVAYTTDGDKPSDDFRTLERLLDAVDWTAEKVSAAEKFEKNKAYCRERNLPCFIPPDGKCFACHKQVFSDGNRGPKWDTFITGCPHCHRTFCD